MYQNTLTFIPTYVNTSKKSNIAAHCRITTYLKATLSRYTGSDKQLKCNPLITYSSQVPYTFSPYKHMFYYIHVLLQHLSEIMSKWKRTELTLNQKVDLIQKSAGRSQCSLADEYQVGKTQVQNILKKKSEYLTAWKENCGNDRKRLCSGLAYQDIDTLTWQWFQTARSKNLPASGPMIQKQALQFAERIERPDLKASCGLLNSFKSRHNLTGATLIGEREARTQTSSTSGFNASRAS